MCVYAIWIYFVFANMYVYNSCVPYGMVCSLCLYFRVLLFEFVSKLKFSSLEFFVFCILRVCLEMYVYPCFVCVDRSFTAYVVFVSCIFESKFSVHCIHASCMCPLRIVLIWDFVCKWIPYVFIFVLWNVYVFSSRACVFRVYACRSYFL